MQMMIICSIRLNITQIISFLQYMTAVLSSSLSDKFDGLVPVLVAAEVKHEVDTDPVIENSISFKREVMQQAMGDDLKVCQVVI